MKKLWNRAIGWTAKILIAFYRAHLSGVLGGACRYHPTCSCYAEQAFQQHPPIYALYLTVRRLLRCHPFAPFGTDPLPPPNMPNIRRST